MQAAKAINKTNNKTALIARARFVGICLFLFGIAVFVKLVRVQFYETFQGKKWAEYSAQNELGLDTIPAMRGNIYSGDGSLLATSLPHYFIGIDTRVANDDYFLANVDELANKLATRYKENSASYYKQRLMSSRNKKSGRYVRLKAGPVTYSEREIVKEWPFFRKARGGGGGKFEIEYRRVEPFSPMADRTIGGLSAKTGKGHVGVEASFDKRLSGKPGLEMVESVGQNLKLPVQSSTNIRPEPGLDVYMTLDMNYQDMAESSLRKALTYYQAKYGCVVVMEVETGEIKAMANLTRQPDGSYLEDYNYAIAEKGNPGSTFKLATLMAAIEVSGMDPQKEWVDTGTGAHRFGYMTVYDTKRGGHGKITVQQVLEKSSNIGMHLLMQRYFYSKPDDYIGLLKKFHLYSPTGIHMKGEQNPYLPERNSKGWHKASLTYMSYGYEMLLTPLQMLTFYNAVANNGYWIRPMVVKQIKNADETVDVLQSYVESTPIASPATIRKARTMLEGVIENGTARNIRSPYYSIAGKTGTAQKLIDGQYVKGKYNTSFAGYFPADKPKYSCIVVIDTPSGYNMEQLYAGSVAAPVFKEVADRIFAYDISMHKPAVIQKATGSEPLEYAGNLKDIQAIGKGLNYQLPDTNDDGWGKLILASSGKTNILRQSTSDNTIPDLTGLPLRDALYLMENKGFKVVYKGVGKVVNQAIGTTANQKTITLTLE